LFAIPHRFSVPPFDVHREVEKLYAVLSRKRQCQAQKRYGPCALSQGIDMHSSKRGIKFPTGIFRGCHSETHALSCLAYLLHLLRAPKPIGKARDGRNQRGAYAAGSCIRYGPLLPGQRPIARGSGEAGKAGSRRSPVMTDSGKTTAFLAVIAFTGQLDTVLLTKPIRDSYASHCSLPSATMDASWSKICSARKPASASAISGAAPSVSSTACSNTGKRSLSGP
jgi:hypothetical protein